MFIIDLIFYYFIGSLLVKAYKNISLLLGKLLTAVQNVNVKPVTSEETFMPVSKLHKKTEWQEVDMSDTPLKKQLITFNQKQSFRDN